MEGNLYTLPLQLTPPGTLTAHRRFFLWLLHSCPDQVRRFLLRKTQTSTPLTKGSYISSHPYRILLFQLLSILTFPSLVKQITICLLSLLYSIVDVFLSLSSLRRFRNALKKPVNIIEHSSSNTPRSIST